MSPMITDTALTMAGTANSATASAMAWVAASIMVQVSPTSTATASAMAWVAAYIMVGFAHIGGGGFGHGMGGGFGHGGGGGHR
ncbi:MAG TPA: hypothetical protein VGM17_09640 [Rhizomicrobium sp.]